MSKSLTPKKYAVHSMFYSLQGEGYHAGTAMVFVRFSGCNIWSGQEIDRERDAAKGDCARICDTEFFHLDLNNGGGLYTAEEVLFKAQTLAPASARVMLFTGGEPALQLDEELLEAAHEAGWRTHVETNGTLHIKGRPTWVTLSPKAMQAAVEQACDELKLLYPLYDPAEWGPRAERWRRHPGGRPKHWFLQPVQHPGETQGNLEQTVAYVKAHPEWRLSAQVHKMLGLE